MDRRPCDRHFKLFPYKARAVGLPRSLTLWVRNSEGVVCFLRTLMIRMFILWTYNFTTAKLLTYKKSKNLFFLAFISEFITMKYTSNRNCIFERTMLKFVTYKIYFTKSSFKRRQSKVI